jgi:hypothetical protein
MFMNERRKTYDKFYGAINATGMKEGVTEEQDNIICNYRRKEREAIFENGDIIKYIENEHGQLVSD